MANRNMRRSVNNFRILHSKIIRVIVIYYMIHIEPICHVVVLNAITPHLLNVKPHIVIAVDRGITMQV